MAEPHGYRLVDLGSRRFSNWNFPCPEPGAVELAHRAQVPCPPCSFGFPFPSTCSNLGRAEGGTRGCSVDEALTQFLGWSYLYSRHISLNRSKRLAPRMHPPSLNFLFSQGMSLRFHRVERKGKEVQRCGVFYIIKPKEQDVSQSPHALLKPCGSRTTSRVVIRPGGCFGGITNGLVRIPFLKLDHHRKIRIYRNCGVGRAASSISSHEVSIGVRSQDQTTLIFCSNFVPPCLKFLAACPLSFSVLRPLVTGHSRSVRCAPHLF